MLSSAWRYRHFIMSAIRADVRSRFAHSRLAGFWLLVQPLVQVAIFALILSSVLSSRLPGVSNKYGYTVYLLAGISAWSLFGETLSRCVGVFVDNAGLLKKISFPRVSLPVIVIGASLVNFLALIGVTTIFLLAMGAFPGVAYLWLVPLAGLVCAFGASLGILLGVLNVFMRDVGQLTGVIVSLWFWFTPIVYPFSVVPSGVAAAMKWNPMLPAVTAFQDIMLYGRGPELVTLLPLVATTLVVATFAVVTFLRAAPEMVDVL